MWQKGGRPRNRDIGPNRTAHNPGARRRPGSRSIELLLAQYHREEVVAKVRDASVQGRLSQISLRERFLMLRFIVRNRNHIALLVTRSG